MHSLNTLKNTSKVRKNSIRVGRGIGSKGKTCGRGEKGAGSRSGYKRREGYEGGQFRTFMKLPIRGFSNARFRKRVDSVNLEQIEELYSDGEVVNIETLRSHGYISGKSWGIKVLGQGELTKKVTLEVDAISEGARAKLQKAGIAVTIVNQSEKSQDDS